MKASTRISKLFPDNLFKSLLLLLCLSAASSEKSTTSSSISSSAPSPSTSEIESVSAIPEKNEKLRLRGYMEGAEGEQWNFFSDDLADSEAEIFNRTLFKSRLTLAHERIDLWKDGYWKNFHDDEDETDLFMNPGPATAVLPVATKPDGHPVLKDFRFKGVVSEMKNNAGFRTLSWGIERKTFFDRILGRNGKGGGNMDMTIVQTNNRNKLGKDWMEDKVVLYECRDETGREWLEMVPVRPKRSLVSRFTFGLVGGGTGSTGGVEPDVDAYPDFIAEYIDKETGETVLVEKQ